MIDVEAGHTIANALAVEAEEVPSAVHVEDISFKVSFSHLIAILHHEVIRPFVKVSNSCELRIGCLLQPMARQHMSITRRSGQTITRWWSITSDNRGIF